MDALRFCALTIAAVVLAGVLADTAYAECPDSVLFGDPHHHKDVGPMLKGSSDPDQAARYLAHMEKGFEISRNACKRGSTSGVAGCKDIPFYEKSTAALKCHAEERAAALARRMYSPLDRAYYTKFPDGDARLDAFWKHLSDMREARDNLRTHCTGSSWSEMTKTVRGQVVLIWPERFKECEGYSDLLEHGKRSFETALQNWNKVFKSSYALPKGDATDASAWKQTKSRFLRFTPDSCNDASRRIVYSGESGFADSQASLYERMKSICPSQWRSLFEPAEDIAKREKRKRKFCAPGTSSTQIEEDGAQTILCDESDKDIPSDEDGVEQSRASTEEYIDEWAGVGERPGRQKDSPSDPALAHIDEWVAKGGGRKVPSAGKSAPSSRNVKRGVRGASQGSEVTGGISPSDDVFEGGARPTGAGGIGEDVDESGEDSRGTSTTGDCDDAAELRDTGAMRARRASEIQTIAPALRACAEARLYVTILQRGVNYVIRCNRQGELQPLQNALREARQNERQACNGSSSQARTDGNCPQGQKWIGSTATSGFCWDGVSPFGDPNAASARGSKAPGTRTPTGPTGAGRPPRPSGPSGGRDLCPSGRPRVLDGCPGG
jgi:hypothetical protein